MIDSAYDSDFRFSLGYNTGIDSLASETGAVKTSKALAAYD